MNRKSDLKYYSKSFVDFQIKAIDLDDCSDDQDDSNLIYPFRFYNESKE